jgi:hypothetical protein
LPNFIKKKAPNNGREKEKRGGGAKIKVQANKQPQREEAGHQDKREALRTKPHEAYQLKKGEVCKVNPIKTPSLEKLSLAVTTHLEITTASAFHNAIDIFCL